MKRVVVTCLLISAFLSFGILSTNGQETPPEDKNNSAQKSESELLRKKQAEEKRALREKQKEEKKSLLGKKQEERKRQRKEKKNLRKQQKTEQKQALEKKREERKKVIEQKKSEAEKKRETRHALSEQKREIRKAKRAQKVVSITTKENDPIVILDASIKKSKTDFLKIKGVELEYKVKIKNNTPKIINLFTVIWGKGIPTSSSLPQEVETKIAKPLIPYEERIVKYNEVDNERQGETYSVKVKKVMFEDGTEWQNDL